MFPPPWLNSVTAWRSTLRNSPARHVLSPSAKQQCAVHHFLQRSESQIPAVDPVSAEMSVE